MRSRVSRWLIVGLALLVTSGLPPMSQAATAPSAAVKISGFDIVPKSTAKHVVTLSGSFTNTGQTTISEASVMLATSGPIYTRSELGDVLANRQSVSGKAQPGYRVTLGSVKSGESRAWKLRFTLETVLGRDASGVYAFGAIVTTQELTTSTYITAPWFDSSSRVTPTKVALAVPLTTTNRHVEARVVHGSATDSLALSRLTNLVSAKHANSVSWMVDPALKPWFKDLSQTELGASARQFTTHLSKILSRSMLTPFGHANLAGLATSNEDSEIVNLIEYGNNIWSDRRILYSSPDGTMSSTTMKQLILNSVTPMVSNAFSTGNPRVTSNAHSSIRGQDVLVFDEAASSCLATTVTSKNAFVQRMCLASELGMMTAESPAVSRTVVVLAPTQWDISSKRLDALIASLQDKNWVSITSLTKVLSSSDRTTTNLSDNSTQKPMSPNTLRLAKVLHHEIKVTESMVTDPHWRSSVSPAQLLGYSDLWLTTSQAHAYLNGQIQSVKSIAKNVTIQTSSRITIASTRSEIPITVVNAGRHDVKIRVTLQSDTPGKFTAQPSPLFGVPIGKRVTVSVPITVAGTGVINASVELLTPDGHPVGEHYEVRISSTAYQKVASALVRAAFGILLLLALSNFVRRRKKPDVESSTTS